MRMGLSCAAAETTERMKAFVLMPHAAPAVSDIWDYIASESTEAADRGTWGFGKAMDNLAQGEADS